MKYLLKYARAYRAECITGPLFKLLEASFELCVPLVMKKIIDVGIGTANRGYIMMMSGILILLGVLGLSATVTAQYFSAKAAVGIVSEIKKALFARIQGFSYTELDEIGTATMITRITTDANQVQTGINLTLRLFLRSPFVVFGAMVMAFTVDAHAAITFAVVIPLLSAVVFGIMLACLPLYKRVQKKLEQVLRITRENLSGVRVLRAFCREEEQIRDFSESVAELKTEQEKVGRISALMNPLTYILINFAVIVLIYSGAVRVDGGLLSQGALVSLYNYMLLILTELIKLASLIITITKSVASEHRIEALLDTESSLKFPKDMNFKASSEYKVEFNNVSLKYKGSPQEALSNIEFKVKQGQTVGIIGGTGSGKTSLVNLIPRFYDVCSGEVLIDGINVKKYTAEQLRGKIGIVPQKAVLFRGTILDNLLWGDEKASAETISEALAASQSADFVDLKPGGINAEVEQGGRNFSGGQRQRLTIARALVKKPEILILDDSTSALDFATDAALRKALCRLPYKPTVFTVSQRTSAIRYADIIIVLDDGKAVGIGTHEELLASCEVYREIHKSQFKEENENEK